VNQNAARVPELPIESLFHATASMNPSFRFDDVDIVINWNSFRKFLDFSADRRQDAFRLNLALVHRTLVVERSESTARTLIRVSQKLSLGKTR
jgi:hypothetical protein